MRLPKWLAAPRVLTLSDIEAGSDARYLPRSTNMRLPGSMIPGISRPEDAIRAARGASKLTERAGDTRAAFVQSIPCIAVTDMKISVEFYNVVLSFVNLSPRDEGRVIIFRGAPGVTPQQARQKAPGVRIILRTASGRTPAQQELHIHVTNVDDVFAEAARRLVSESQTQNEYFPHTYFRDAHVLRRPQMTAWRTRECAFLDPDGNILVFVQD